jgi:phospholipid transport system substrate-binding protein
MLRNVLTLGFAAWLALGGASARAQLLQPPPERPDALMRAATAEVIAVLRQDLGAGRPTDVAVLVEDKILPLFDFDRMTRIAMARNWRLASPEQQAALVVQFRTLLVRTYSTALSEYRDQEIEYRPLRGVAGDTEVLVRSFLRRPGTEPLTIDYDMEDGLAGWKVFDVKIAGISLVLNYRESFAAAVRSGGIEGLIKSLADRNRQNAPGAKGAEAGPFARLMLYTSGLLASTESLEPGRGCGASRRSYSCFTTA